MKNISKNKIFVKAAFIPHLKKWVFPQPNHNIDTQSGKTKYAIIARIKRKP